MISTDEFEAESFKEIIVEEYDKYYVVKLISEDGGEMSFREDKGGTDKLVVEMIEMFLNSGKINKVFNKIPLINTLNNRNYVEVGNLANRNLKISLYNPKFKFLSDMIFDKYMDDRYEFLENNDIKEIRLSSKDQKVMYGVEDSCVNITLCTDYNSNIISLERDAMKKYLYNKFDMIGEEVTIEHINDRNGLNKETIIRCGDFKMSFPQQFTYSVIIGIVNDYNNGIDRGKKR